MKRTTAFVILLCLASAVTTHGGTILVQWSDDGATNLAATWSGDFDVSGYALGTPTTQNGQRFFATSAPNFVLDFVGSSSPSLVNYHINTAAPTVTPPFFFIDNSLTQLGVTTATPFDIIWDGVSIGLNLPVQGNQTVSGSGTWFGGTVSTVFGNNLPLFQTVTIFNDGVGNVINFMAVPEPSTYAMLLAGVGCGAAGIVRRRRHSVRTP